MDQPIPHLEGRQGEGKGENSAPETAFPTKLQTGFQFLTKDFLRFWMVDIRWEGHSQRSAPQKRHKAHRTVAPGNWGGDGEGRSRAAPGRVRSSSSRLPEQLRPGRHKTQAQPSLHLCGVPENLNLSILGLGSAHSSGPAPCRAAWSWSSADGGSTHAASGANPVWPEHCECSPHRPVTFVCSGPPSPQHDWTSRPKQETTSARLCQGGN